MDFLITVLFSMNRYILGETDVGSYKIVSVTEDGTYCEYLGDARK